MTQVRRIRTLRSSSTAEEGRTSSLRSSSRPPPRSGASAGPLETALAALSRRAMTGAEVEAHLRRKGIASADIADVLKRLIGFGYVDDARYATDYIATRGKSRALGPARLRGELARRGIARETIDAALALAAEEGSVALDDASRALEKLLRGKKAPVDRKGRDRLRAALARRGFGGAAIARAMAGLGSQEEDLDDTGGEQA